MPVYNFKTIGKVPSAKDFIDIVLSRTQRKTPTVVRRGWKISRIRSFYIRKIKFTQDNYNEKLTRVLDEFPRLDDIHPFYADLINVLYSRDHYKLALGQINTARQTIDNLAKDYLRLLKFGDSLYRCKELKRAALGRMCTCMKKLNSSLLYLEQVRQHLSRLPSIDPSTRTLLITGYPNVGKSSFINKVSRADVDVQPYAFTTKSLFVGHFNHKYTRWQVIDTPGILDHPLEQRNTIEMQAITALAHLQSTVLFFIDISESCGYTIEQQVSLFHSIKPLFTNKPLLIVLNKIDLMKIEDLSPEKKALIETVKGDKDIDMIPMSNVSEIGVSKVKETACNMLLEMRVQKKLNSKRIDDIVGRIQLTKPAKRDNKERTHSIPQSVLDARKNKGKKQLKPKKKLEKQLELEAGGPGIYSYDSRKNWSLANPDWKYDAIPKIMDGKNVADFIHPDIEKMLDELEREEEELERAADDQMEDDISDLDEDEKHLLGKIRHKRHVVVKENLLKSTNNKPTLPRRAKVRTIASAAESFAEKGLETEKFVAATKKRGRKRTREVDDDAEMEDTYMQDIDGETGVSARTRSRSRSKSLARDVSSRRAKDEGIKDPKAIAKARKLLKKGQKKFIMNARGGEADRRVLDEKPKHLFSGKRGIGKTDRR